MSVQRRVGVALVMSGPSGVGKSTIRSALLANEPGLRFSVSRTTRPPRAGEVDGVDYQFTTPAAFRAGVEAGQFLEHATVHGHSYGTPRDQVAAHVEAGVDVLLDIDVQGAAQVRARAAADPVLSRAVEFLFIAPPSMAELERRLRSRGTDAPETVARRLAAAKAEIEHAAEYDFILVNDQVDRACAAARSLLAALRMRSVRLDMGFLR